MDYLSEQKFVYNIQTDRHSMITSIVQTDERKLFLK